MWRSGSLALSETFALTRREMIVALGAFLYSRSPFLSAKVGGVDEMESFQINNRRYLGNKYKLLGELRRIVNARCGRLESFVDIFAGTGAVASAFMDKKLITNDILYSNYICHIAWFSGEGYSQEKIERLIREYNSVEVAEENYMSNNFADTYFSKEDCRVIGHIRQDIEDRYTKGEINVRERALLITALLYAMDKIANTVGHYDAYRKGVAPGRHLKLRLPLPPFPVHCDNEFYNEDANALARRIVADFIFMDPPYNSRQYSDAYHLLENVARWEKPAVTGVARKMERSRLKSDFCTHKAEDAFAELVARVRADWIMLTYNNMAEQGNDRSNAKLSDQVIMRTLSAKGSVEVFTVAHKAFSAGRSSRNDNAERVFLCRCRPEPLVASPLNYTGGKFKLLPQLLPHFPKSARKCVDVFCGGCNVGVNMIANEVTLNDSCHPLVAMLKSIMDAGADAFERGVCDMIRKFNLSDSETNGYGFYGCESGSGLGKYNKDRYMRLRRYYATLENNTFEKHVALYVLVVYAFNNQIRFNAKGEFNLPVGKRDFNEKMRVKLRMFAKRLDERAFKFSSLDFRGLDVTDLGKDDFVYADPPYLVTTASYNEGGGWSESDERDLLALLERLHRQRCRFALSNVTESNGRMNTILQEWLNRYKNEFQVVEIERNYSNSNYHRKNSGKTREILVVNYQVEV